MSSNQLSPKLRPETSTLRQSKLMKRCRATTTTLWLSTAATMTNSSKQGTHLRLNRHHHPANKCNRRISLTKQPRRNRRLKKPLNLPLTQVWRSRQKSKTMAIVFKVRSSSSSSPLMPAKLDRRRQKRSLHKLLHRKQTRGIKTGFQTKRAKVEAISVKASSRKNLVPKMVAREQKREIRMLNNRK